MAPHDTIAPEPRHPLPAPVRLLVDCRAALLVEPDQDNQVVIIQLAAEPDARLFLSPEIALDLSLRLTGAVARLRRGGQP